MSNIRIIGPKPVEPVLRRLATAAAKAGAKAAGAAPQTFRLGTSLTEDEALDDAALSKLARFTDGAALAPYAPFLHLVPRLVNIVRPPQCPVHTQTQTS